MKGLEEMLRNVDPKTLEKGMEQASAFAKTPEGKAMMDKLKENMPADKDGLMKLLEENPSFLQSLGAFFKK